jgi:hypothetical protein
LMMKGGIISSREQHEWHFRLESGERIPESRGSYCYWMPEKRGYQVSYGCKRIVKNLR